MSFSLTKRAWGMFGLNFCSSPNKFSQDKKQKHLHRIETAGKQMTTLMEDILCLSRVDSGKIAFHPQPLELIPFCQDLIE